MSFNTNITFDCSYLCPLWAIKMSKSRNIVRCECYNKCGQKSIYVCLQCGDCGNYRQWGGNHLKSTRAHQLLDGQINPLNIINLQRFLNEESRERNESNTHQPAFFTSFIPAMESDFCTVIDDSSSTDSHNESMFDNCIRNSHPHYGLAELPEQTQKRVRFSDDYCQEMFLDSICVDLSTNPLTMQNELMRFILSYCYSGSDKDRAQFMCNAVGKGFHNVAHQAIFHKNLTLDQSQAVNPIDLPFHFLFAQLSLQLSKPCRKMLAAIVQYASLSATNICIPCSPDDCRSVWC